MSIVAPQLNYQFRVEIIHPDKEIQKTISAQVTGTTVNYTNRTIDIEIEQPSIGGALHEVLWEMCDTTRPDAFNTIMLYGLTAGGNTPAYVVRLKVEPANHKFNLDYSNGNTAKHALSFNITGLYTVDAGSK